MKVEIKQGGVDPLILGGQIRENTFEGSYNNMYTTGGFYGREARDMGGLFMSTAEENKNVHGVFDATMDSCGNNKCPNAKVSNINLANFKLTE